MNAWTVTGHNIYRYDFDSYTAYVYWGEMAECWYFSIWIGDKYIRGADQIYDADSAMIMAGDVLWDEVQSNEQIRVALAL
jgi:hypothetical protein